jgi:PAS domain S-box-containing protein
LPVLSLAKPDLRSAALLLTVVLMSLVPPPLDLLPVFNAQPGANLLLAPDWVIVGASDDYLAATLTERATIVGQHIFDAFPDNPDTPEANAVANVRASLAQVMATKQPHEMAAQHYDVPDRTRPGHFVERHWQPRHLPVLDAQGQVQFIIQSVQDITASRLAERQLRESQAGEQAAHAEAERERAELQRVFADAPVAMSLLRGPDFVVEWANPRMGQLWGRPVAQVLGHPHFEALPDLVGQGFEQVFADVRATGQPRTLQELPVRIAQDQQAYYGYFDLTFQPVYDGPERISGILLFAVEVTEQVRARQQVQTLNEELAALNEELRASNEEYQLANTAFGETQQQLRQLNQALEARVQERTSQLVAAQATTERQRRQWHELFMRAPASICIFDGPEWVYEFVNPGYQAMFPGRALLGKRLIDALPEVAGQPLMAILHRVYDTGESFEASEVLVPLARNEGGPIEDIYFDLTYQARYNEAGQIDGFVTYAYDVTAQVLARREREARQGQLQHLFEQAPVAICVFRGPAYVLELVNPPMSDMLGQPPAALLGRPFFEALPELASQGLREVLDGVRQTGIPFVAAERTIYLPHRPQGAGPGYYSFTYQPLRDEQGHLGAITCVAIDVTLQVMARQQVQDLNEDLAAINEELTATNEELNESNTQLTRTNVDLDTFVYTASHDLKAPITNIEAIVLALRAQLPTEVQQDEVVAHLLGLLDTTVARFQFTIGQLTDISRLQLAHTGPAEPVYLAAVLDSVRLDLAPALAAASTQLTADVSPDLVISFSPANLRSIVYNLLSNAVKYRDPERPSLVRVHAAQTSLGAVLTVQDNGLGMSEVQQRQLFGLFQRLHTHVEGTGVGLYITKRLVENGGGTIAVQSQPGVGTTFAVTFPA